MPELTTGLTTLGSVHTAVGLIAVGAGLAGFVRDKAILPRTANGRLYVWSTAITCLTGFPIMRHGGFNEAHALGVITLLTLAAVWWADRSATRLRFRPAPYLVTVGMTATFFFHLIPAFVESSTRLPVGNPWVADRNGPEIKAATGLLFLGLLATTTWQVRRLKRNGGVITDGFD